MNDGERIRRLREGLARFGEHIYWCGVEPKCDCGLTALLTDTAPPADEMPAEVDFSGGVRGKYLVRVTDADGVQRWTYQAGITIARGTVIDVRGPDTANPATGPGNG